MGAFATRLIPRGTIVWVRDTLDRAIRPQELARMPDIQRDRTLHFGFFDRHGDLILAWDQTRYVNHDCEPSCISPGYEFELAVRDIRPGEQLTNDYATLNLTRGFECACGSAGCRGRFDPRDAALHVQHWDQQLRAVWPTIALVDQPLWPLVLQAHPELPTELGPDTPVDALPFRSSREHLVGARRRRRFAA